MGIGERVYSEERMDFFIVQYFMERHLFDRRKLFLIDPVQSFFIMEVVFAFEPVLNNFPDKTGRSGFEVVSWEDDLLLS